MPSSLRGIEPHDLAWIEGRLHYGGVPIDHLARETGTPAFIYLKQRVCHNYMSLAESCAHPPWSTRVYYSAKTAGEPGLLRVLNDLGSCIEVACLHELRLALRAGFEPSRIMLDGPAHTREVIRDALDLGVRLIKVDSLDQLHMAASASEKVALQVLLRLRAPGSRWFQSPAEGLIGRFGMGRAAIRSALEVFSAHPGIRLGGFAIHVGSQVAGTGPYRHAVRMLAQASRDAEDAGLHPSMLDVGGGFPSATLRSPSAASTLRSLLGRARTPPLTEYGHTIRQALATERVPSSISTLIVEPGRAVVGPAAVLLTRVVAVKGSWVFLDATKNFVPESLLFAHRVFLPTRHGDRVIRQNLAGCTLNGGDVLALRAHLPRCEVGDVLVMLDAGAYTLSKACRFTTLLPAAYLMTEGGALEVLRKRESSDEVA